MKRFEKLIQSEFDLYDNEEEFSLYEFFKLLPKMNCKVELYDNTFDSIGSFYVDKSVKKIKSNSKIWWENGYLKNNQHNNSYYISQYFNEGVLHFSATDPLIFVVILDCLKVSHKHKCYLPFEDKYDRLQKYDMYYFHKDKEPNFFLEISRESNVYYKTFKNKCQKNLYTVFNLITKEGFYFGSEFGEGFYEENDEYTLLECTLELCQKAFCRIFRKKDFEYMEAPNSINYDFMLVLKVIPCGKGMYNVVLDETLDNLNTYINKHEYIPTIDEMNELDFSNEENYIESIVIDENSI